MQVTAPADKQASLSGWTDIATFVQFHAKEKHALNPANTELPAQVPVGGSSRKTQGSVGHGHSGQGEHVKSEPDNAVTEHGSITALQPSFESQPQDHRPLSNAGTAVENLLFGNRRFFSDDADHQKLITHTPFLDSRTF
ncbi:Protein scd2/ral3 [Fusarium oxysporum f. sp. albedinis]|nr:Protein scd2/ral3 [Fusarium oxysporum f. sp. albedinis]